MNCSQKLNEILRYAAQNVDYYKSKIDFSYATYSDFPIIDKNTLVDNYDSFVIPQTLPTIKNWTSGTTGIPVQIQWTSSDYQHSYFQLWKKRKKWYNIIPTNRCLTFHAMTTNVNQFSVDNILSYNHTLSIRKDKIFRNGFDNCFKIIEDFSPEWILGSPSIVLELALYLKINNKRLPMLRYIELNGEDVQECARGIIKEIFGIPIANLYGTIEFNGIALSCPNNNLHILDENVFVEYYNGELLITSLSNKTMPLIRYRIGDQAKIQNIVCCGKPCSIIYDLHGRISENIYVDHQCIPKSVFSRIIEELNLITQKVIRYQIVVNSVKSSIILNLLVDPKYSKEIIISKQYYLDQLYSYHPTSKIINYDIALCKDINQFVKSSACKIQEIVYI